METASELGLYEFSQDVTFTSPSTAASVVLAQSANGRELWRTEGDGRSYNEWLQSLIDVASH